MAESSDTWHSGVVPASGMDIEVRDTRPGTRSSGKAWRPVPTYRVTFHDADAYADAYTDYLSFAVISLRAPAVVALGGNVRVELNIPPVKRGQRTTTVQLPGQLVGSRPAMDVLEASVRIELDINVDNEMLLRALFHEAVMSDETICAEWTPTTRIPVADEERRSHERHPFMEEVRLRSATLESVGRGIDLSEGGVSICALNLPPDPRGPVEVMIAVPDGQPAFKAHGRVAWARPASFGGTHLVGVEFEPLAEHTRRRIQRWTSS